MKRTAGVVSAILASAAAAAAVALPDAAGIKAPATFASLAAVALLCAWVHLLCTPGYRRLPFWLAALGGTALLATIAGARHRLPVHEGLAVAAGFMMLVTARVVMARRTLSPRRFVLLFVPVTGALLLAAGLLGGDSAAGAAPADGAFAGSRLPGPAGELERLVGMLHPAYRRYHDEVAPYVRELAADDEITAEEAQRLIEELNERIAQLEGEVARFEAAREELDAYADEVERLRLRVGDLDAGGGQRLDAGDIERVTGYEEAVRPAVPIVRDFAVRLASEHPGTYYRVPGDRLPGAVGIRQVLTIHRYVAAKWRYVNDPLVVRGNYYSPPERTIALGLAGDCDDFAVLIASAVEAIGGRARIVHGICAEGAHAWAEVHLGDRAGWQTAIEVLAEMYPGRSVSRIPERDGGDYWLSLDWQAGRFTCGGSPVVHYESGRRVRG